MRASCIDLLKPDSPPRIMGILNVTADSFSDGGQHLGFEPALRRAREMIQQGATLIDVGAESTRPGAEPVSDAVQIERVVPLIETLRSIVGEEVLISIDARRTAVAERAVQAGADIINDVEAGKDDGMLELAAKADTPIVLMHMQGQPQTMQDDPYYDDVVEEVLTFLSNRAEAAVDIGVARSKVIIDPGIGFGKNRKHNLTLVGNLKRFVETGYPVLLGTSRKRFMGAICRETVFSELVGATCATTAIGVRAGVRIFRVHDVRENRQAMEVALAIDNDGLA